MVKSEVLDSVHITMLHFCINALDLLNEIDNAVFTR